MKNVGVVCFLATYFIAFCLEIARFQAARRRSSTRIAFQTAAIAVAAFGAFAHGAFLYYNDWLENARFFVDARGWFLVLAFCVVVSHLYLSLVYPKAQFGPFLLPAVFVLCAIGIGASDATFAPEATCRWTRAAHGFSLLAATALTFVGAVSGATYFLQRSRLKRKIFSFDLAPPSLEWLGRTTRFSANVALLFFGIGVASGYYLKIFAVRSDAPILFGDPVALAATVLFLAVVFRRIVRMKSDADDAADAAILSLVCAVVFAAILAFSAFSTSGHWKAPPPSEPSAPAVSNSDETPISPVSPSKEPIL